MKRNGGDSIPLLIIEFNLQGGAMLRLVDMTKEEFEVIKGRMISDYAKDKVRAGHWSQTDAIDLSKETFEKILNSGIETEGHYFLNVYDKEQKVGFLWVNLIEEGLYLNNLLVYDEFKKSGYEKEVIQLLEERARELRAQKIFMHNFGYDENTVSLYQGLGYKVTDVYYKKNI